MAKIKLKTLGLEYTTGELIQASDVNDSATDYVAVGSGKSINEIYFQDSTGVLGGERLGTEHNVWIPFSGITDNATPKRGDRLLLKLNKSLLSLDVTVIAWQSGNTIKYTFASGTNLNTISIGDYVTFTTATQALNNGTFRVTKVGALYLEVENTGISDASKNEATSPAILTYTNSMFEVVDIKQEIMSGFQDHYELNIANRND